MNLIALSSDMIENSTNIEVILLKKSTRAKIFAILMKNGCFAEIIEETPIIMPPNEIPSTYNKINMEF